MLSIQRIFLAALAVVSLSEAFLPVFVRQLSKHASFMTTTETAWQDLPSMIDGVVAKKLESIDESAGISKYGFDIEIKGEVTGRIYRNLEKELRSKAAFPGFRKGQIPPFARAQVASFAVEEAINDSLINALEAHGLEKLEGADGNAQVKQKVEELVKDFKPGNPFCINATVNAREKQSSQNPEKSEPTA